MNFYFSYTGNKRTEFKYIEKYLKETDYKTFVEPFCGSCSTSLLNYYKNNKKDIQYVLNDIDKIHMSFLESVKKDGNINKYIDFCNEHIKDITKDKHNKIILKYKENKDDLLLHFYYNKVYSFRKGMYDDRRKRNLLELNKFDKLNNFFCLDTVKLFNIDFMEIMEKYKDDEKAFLYFDPPYLDSFNSFYVGYEKRDYENIKNLKLKCKDQTKMYIDIFNFLEECKCSVIMIINGNAINKHIFKKYTVETYLKSYSYTHKTKEFGFYKKQTEHIIILKR